MPALGFADELDDADLRQYSELGFAFRNIAELDYQLEAFMFCLSKHAPKFCTRFSKPFPNTFQEKIDFVIECYRTFPQLRSFGDAAGRSDPNFLCYGFEEVFAFRNAFFHSATTLVKFRSDGFIWDVTRHERTARRSFRRVRSSFGSGYLDRMVDLSRYLVHWLVTAERSMDGEHAAEFRNRAHKINTGFYLSLTSKIWETRELP